MEAWDGTERRVGDSDRRKAQRAPFQEYPKMVNGVTFQTAEEEAAANESDDWSYSDEPAAPDAAPKSKAKAGKKK